MEISTALSVRSDFSVGESMLQVDKMVSKAQELGLKTLGLVDTNLGAMVDFSNRCKKAGIRPVIGFRVRVAHDPTYRKPSKSSGIKPVDNPTWIAKVYLKSAAALESVMALLTKANSPEYFYFHPRIGLDDLMTLKDVVITTGDQNSLFATKDHMPALHRLMATFANDVFVELSPVNTPLHDRINLLAAQAARSTGLNTLVGLPVMYASREDADSRDVLAAVTTNTKMDAPFRSVPYVRDFSLESAKKLTTAVKETVLRLGRLDRTNVAKEFVEGLANIERVVARCGYTFERQEVSLPKMAENEFDALQRLCVQGWNTRFKQPVLGHVPSDLGPYKERLKYELGVLKKMNFSGYFLLVADLVKWSKDNGILVGPGRGSVGGSLVAYLCGITDVDPLRFNLFFERFINPDRIDLPDADLDFMSSRRHEVQDYLVARYGKDRVAGISNYAALGPASAMRDTGRVFGLRDSDLMATKLVPKEHGISTPLAEAIKVVPEIEKFSEDHPGVWNHALKLEGSMRAFGRHAAGIIVAGEPVVKRAVLETRDKDESIPAVIWDKRVVEDWGLIKMDLLGLSTLDILDIAKRYIKKRHGKVIDYLRVPLDDPKVLDAFGRGETTGVFQFESPGMRKLLRDLRKGGPLTFDDITAATALYRPGPMDSGMMQDFVNIKQGVDSPYYEHPNMEPALRDTYGVIVYQEQVMQIARDIAGYSMSGADALRKIMGKKDKEKMSAERETWVKGCMSTSGLSESVAGNLFDKIAAFAGYGFNKSHACEYSIISVWTMWLRVNYAAEYFAACMSIVKEEKLPGLVSDAREAGIEVLPPDINLSGVEFSIPDSEHIVAPFSAMKGCSTATAARIVELRERNRDWKLVRVKKKRDGSTEDVYGMDLDTPVKGRFDSFNEFLWTSEQPGSKVNAKVVDALRKVGAFAGVDRSELPARHPDRRKDQMELLPGLIIDTLKADRTTDASEPFLRKKIVEIVRDYRECDGCSLAGNPHPSVRVKSKVKFMVVSDCPSWPEEKADKLLEGDGGTFVKNAIKNAGLEVGDGYYTTLVKAKKTDKFLTNEQLNGCRKFLDRELELIKPPAIVALGSASIRRLLPDVKGGTEELAGKAVYVPALDATVICGINPAQIIFNESKGAVLDAIFEKLAEVVL